MGEKRKLVMVDLDGTLVDTLAANYRAYSQALNEHGYALSLETYAGQCDGRSYKDFLPELLGEGTELMEEIHEKKKRYYPDCLKYAVVNGHLVAMLKAMRREYHIALVTTASRANVESILGYFDLESLFDLVVTQEDVKKSKPDPTCYLKAREHFGVKAEDAVIFEDSSTGLKAALASGSDVYMFRKAEIGGGERQG